MPSRRNRRKSPSPAPAPSASNGSSRDSSSLSPVRSRATMESDVDDGTPVTALEGIPDFDPEDLDTADMQAIGDGEGTEDVEEVEDADAVEDAEDEEEGEGEGGDDAEEVEGTEGGDQGDDAEESEGDGDEDDEDDDDEEEEDDDEDDDDKDDDDDEDDNDKDDEDEDKDDEEKDDDEEEGEEDEEETAEATASPSKPPSPLTFRYPPAVPDITTVSDRERAFKVARFIECTVDECDCSGLQPPSGSSVTVAAANDDAEMADGTEADIGAVRTEEGWWRQCGVCSHGWEGDEGHVFAVDVPDIERRRREKVVGRIEELLQDEGVLATFPTPEPESTESLRRQLSEFVRPSGKRPAAPLPRRFDLTEEGTPFEGTPFEDTEGEGDEEGRPRKRARLSADDADKEGGDKAAENGGGGGEANGDGAHHQGKKPAGKTSGKAKGAAARTVGGTAAGADPALQAGDEEDDDDDTPLAARRGPELDDRERRRRAEIKEKERAREDQVVSRAAKEGVAQEEEDKRDVEMWQGVELPQLPPRPAMLEQQRREIILPVVSSRTPTAVASILLIGLKNLFQKQLPKMPREYITRLVLDKNHISMPIVKRGWKVVGGICYRPFESRGFAEIVFCAVDSSEQVKGYGSHLMNALKDHVREAHPTINHFLTYADNYAVGYFKKQGFTKEISYPRERWVGYIKDYEGGTIMQCTMLPKVKYTEVHQMLADQKAAILAKIRTISKSHVVQPGLDVFKDRKPGQQIKLSKEDIPGLTEAGWDPALDEIIRQPKRNPHFALLQQVLNDLQNDPSAWPFVKPVDSNVVTDYYNVIKNPMDLSTMEYKLDNNHYVGIDDFVADARLIFANCRQYNGEKNQYAVLANKLERSLDRIMKKRQAAIVT